MHVKRWITAVILLPPVILVILWGGNLVFTILAVLIGTITMGEYYRIVFQNHEPRVSPFYPVWGYVNGALIIFAAAANQTTLMLVPLVLNIVGVAFVSLFRFKTSRDAPMVVAKQTFGLIYIPMFLSGCVLLYIGSEGPFWLLFLLGIVAMGDTGAYYVGSYFGRHKLCPAVSPKKSVEGAVGGLAANVVFALIFKLLFLNQISIPACILFALVTGAIGQVGDLFESEFKRAGGIKDSGNLLPGHGGFLDRIDALLFASPAAYLLKELLIS